MTTCKFRFSGGTPCTKAATRFYHFIFEYVDYRSDIIMDYPISRPFARCNSHTPDHIHLMRLLTEDEFIVLSVITE